MCDILRIQPGQCNAKSTAKLWEVALIRTGFISVFDCPLCGVFSHPALAAGHIIEPLEAI